LGTAVQSQSGPNPWEFEPKFGNLSMATKTAARSATPRAIATSSARPGGSHGQYLHSHRIALPSSASERAA
jgi:hypothetical protein